MNHNDHTTIDRARSQVRRLRDRAEHYRRHACGWTELVATAYRRRAQELELQAAVLEHVLVPAVVPARAAA